MIAGGGLAGIGGGSRPGFALHATGGRVREAAVSAARRNLDISCLLSGVSVACQPPAFFMVSRRQHGMPDTTSTPYCMAICSIAVLCSSKRASSPHKAASPGITKTKQS